MNRATKGTIWPAPKRTHRGVPLEYSFRPGFLGADHRLAHGELTIAKDMEVRAVAVYTTNRWLTVPIVYEAFRDSDPLEDRVGRA
jgi:hypothetical protein